MRILDPLTDPKWDEKLLAHDDASIFHTAAWARVLADSYGYSGCYLAETADDRFTFLLPLMDVRSLLTGRRGVSLPFTDFCDPLATENMSDRKPADMLIALGRERGWRYFEVRGGESFYEGSPPSMAVFSHTLDLNVSEEALFGKIRDSTRRNITKARREGVEVRIGDSLEMLEAFYQLNCLTRREHGLPPQPLSFFQNLHKHLLARGQGCTALATVGGRAVAGAVYLHHGRNVLYKFGASDRRLQSLRPNDLVMWEAIRWYRERGFERLSFGRTEVEHEGLRRYKIGWGAQEQVKHYYRYDFTKPGFGRAIQKRGAMSSAMFRRLPLRVSRAIGAALYRHVA